MKRINSSLEESIVLYIIRRKSLIVYQVKQNNVSLEVIKGLIQGRNKIRRMKITYEEDIKNDT